jgi:GT2 family glycosyltransferase
MDSLDIVIVSYRCRRLLRDCLLLLREYSPRRPMQVFVVDNASVDGTVEMLEREFSWVQVFPAGRNLGFARANNAAIRAGRAPYVLALNPDTRVTAGALDRMLDVMDIHPEVGIAGCRLELEDGSFDHAAKRRFPTPLGALAHFTGIGRRPGAPRALAQYRAPELGEFESGPVDAVNGAFMLMRRSALDDVGLFDEGYWLYMEDLDLCYRFKQAGWVIWYEPSATVVHVKAGTSGKHRRPRMNYAFHYGMYRFYRQHYSRRHNAATNVAVYAAIATKLAISVLRNALGRSAPPALGPPYGTH